MLMRASPFDLPFQFKYLNLMLQETFQIMHLADLVVDPGFIIPSHQIANSSLIRYWCDCTDTVDGVWPLLSDCLEGAASK